MTDHSPPSPFTPIERRRVKISDTKKVAAGIPATMSTMKHSIKKMGIIRTAKSLTMVNQKHGLIVQVVLGPTHHMRRHLNFVRMGPKQWLMKP